MYYGWNRKDSNFVRIERKTHVGDVEGGRIS
jgi:hypothetical protein